MTKVQKLEEIWKKIIKLRAGYRSELSGKLGKQVGGDTILAAHHICGKPNHALRFDLENGICLDNGSEHIHGVHSKNPMTARMYQDKIIDYIGIDRWERLVKKSHGISKKSLREIEEELKKELAKYEPVYM